jgi:hypothetical protein
MVKLFGFEIKRSEDDQKDQPVSFAEPINDDGALTVGGAVGGSYGMLLDLEGTAKSEAELVTRYRSLTVNPEIQQAVDEIVNEAISVDSHDKVVNIVLDETDLSDKVKEKISEEFQTVLQLLDFSNSAYEIFYKFYVDGRLNYHVIIDEKNLKEGIKELRYLDPRKIRLIREMERENIKEQGTNVSGKRIKKEYYMYSETGFGASKVSNFSSSIQGLRIAKDSIVRVTSGLLNENNSVVLSHLHKSIKSLNQLRILEDATVIYTMTRAPERRIFYVDVGNLPKAKAEQYLHDMMARHKNRVTYDPSSGEIRDDRKMMTMTEDYWFPRREGSNSTEVTTLAAGQGLGEDRNLPYFQSKLYKSLNVPVARLQPETMYSFGRMSEVTREELKFAKFIRRLRTRFSILFDRCLERQLVLKGIITPDEWKEIQNKVRYDFMKDNYFEELKEAEILKEKLETLRQIEEQIGKYFSREWVVKHVLYMPEDEWKEMQKQIKKEAAEEPIDDPTQDEPSNSAPDQAAGDQPAEESLTIINRKNLNKIQRKVQK